MNKVVLTLLAPLAFLGLMTSASAGDLTSAVLELGTCYTPKHTIKFYLGGEAQLLPANFHGPDASADPDDANSYQNAYDGKEDGQGGVWTSWKVRGNAVYVHWLNPSYWSKLGINFHTTACRFQN